MDLVRLPLRYALMWIEGWLDRIFGANCNPFYNLGALGYFYFWIVAATGIYVYIFFDTGVTEAYDSVEKLTYEQWYLGGIMRSMHRYASAALVAMMVLHMVREFAFDHYRGSRSFSWITGVPLIWLILGSGITGYWLVWDQLGQYVGQASAEWLDWLPIFGEPISRNFMSKSHLDDRFFTLLIFLHIGVPLAALFLMWFHLQRVAYARVNPPRGLAIGTFLMMLGLSLVVPAESQGPADLSRVPTDLGLDWFYLFAYPLVDVWGAGAIWALAAFGTLALIIMPWLPPKKAAVTARVNLDHCNGCTRCAMDCPFNAITMRPRTDDDSPYDTQAEVNPDACVSCGICFGACPTATPFRSAGELVAGIDLPDLDLAALTAKVTDLARPAGDVPRILMFGCAHGVKASKLTGVAAVELPCTGMLQPSFVDYVLSRNIADGVVVGACRSGECHYRLGLVWTEDRFVGERDPRLRRRVPRERVLVLPSAPTDWRRVEREIASFGERLTALGPMPAPTMPQRRRRTTDGKDVEAAS